MQAEEARILVRETVHQTLLQMGVDVSNPDAVKAMQADFAFMRASRRAGEALRAHTVRTFFWVVGTAILGGASWLIASLEWRPHP